MITYIELTPHWINVKLNDALIGQIIKYRLFPTWLYSPDTWRHPKKNFKTIEEAKAYIENTYCDGQ